MHLPPYRTIFGDLNITDFWLTVKYFLFYFAPFMMIYVAFKLVEMIAPLIRNIMPNNKSRRYYDEDDDEYYDY